MDQAIHLICREGKLEDLLAQLATHRLDVVLANEPPVGLLNTRTFTHRLGKSPITICGAPAIARRLRRRFPRSLHDAPALLPATNTSTRRSLEKWFQAAQVRPRVLAEFEDLAMMKAMAADGKGFIALPAAALAEAKVHYGFEAIGRAGKYQEQYYAITAERRIEHPAIAGITQRARNTLRV
jgi:LysR family transcriptional activator of nhaA